MSSGLRVFSRLSREKLLAAAKRYAQRLAETFPDSIRCVVVVGSVARGDHGPFSDIDLLVVVHRPIDYVTAKLVAADELPVPVDLLVVSNSEWERGLGVAVAWLVRLIEAW